MPTVDLKIRDVVVRYGALTALRGISLDVPAGSFVSFLGPSGCGKTTLLRVIAGLEKAESGAILSGETDLARVAARRRNFGVVFQSYSLFPNMSAARNIGYGLACRGWPKAAIAERVAAMLRLVQLAEHAGKLPSEMSGGQQQRIALARALAPGPSLLLLDEPLSALDAKVREELRVEIRDVQRRLGITTIMVTHDQEEALAMADRIVVMRDGRIEQAGTPAELYHAPATAFVAEFVGRMNVLPVAPGGGGVDVRFAGCDLVLASVPATPPGAVGIRPEFVRVEAAEADGANLIAGTVAEVAFLGNLTRISVSPERAPERRLVAELHGGVPVPPVGARVGLRLPPAALTVLS